jgi:acyl-CoA thioesterase-2
MPTLVESLSLERIDRDLFRGVSPDHGHPRIFGGQVIAQCLLAAYETVADRLCHSLHAYFIRPGDPAVPIVFEVDRARDGASFATRRVTAIQDGRQILNLAASFHVEESGFEHQDPMPLEAPDPESLADDDLRGVRSGIQMRSVAPPRPGMSLRISPPRQGVWFRSLQPIGQDQRLHQAVLAYASDYPLMSTAAQPHPITWDMPGVQPASLDHALWFHRPVNVNGWCFYDLDSPSASGARGFNRGALYDRSGRLVASAAQEAMIRVRGFNASRS